MLLCLLFSFSAYAQNVKDNAAAVSIHVEDELQQSAKSNMMSSVLKIKNIGSNKFEGRLKIDLPDGLRTISGVTSLILSVKSNDSIFIPVRYLVQKGISSGNHVISYTLTDSDNNLMDRSQSVFVVEERIDLSLFVENRNMMVTNPEDSIRVSASVTNNGNKGQEVIVVFSIPTMKRGVNFVERKYFLQPQEQHRFEMSFMAQREMIAQNQFSVKVAAMYGAEKNIFGNSTIHIQNVSNHRTFEDPTGYHGLSEYYSRNEISLSHRSTNHGSGITQLNGSADIDLPAGFVNLKGNIYKYGTNRQATATNTSLSYLLGDNEYLIGNVYESLETSLSGRGAKIRLGSTQRDHVVMGFIDQNYNLFSTDPFFNDTYSFFVKGEKVLHGKPLQKILGTAVYQRDGRELSHDVISGGELLWRWQNRWSASLRLHGAVSQLMTDGSRKPSGSAEVRYNGETDGFNLSGNYYISSSHFPGNRKGVLSLQQSVSKRINDFSLNSNAYYSRFSPRSYVIPINTHTGNFMGNADIYFPRLMHVTFGLGYQHQYEHSNSYQQYQTEQSDLEMRANRLRGSMTWSSRKLGQSASLSGEIGRSNNHISDHGAEQYRINLSYSIKWFNLMTQYQHGSYYLSEQVSSGRGSRPYERFISSISVNQQFFDHKLSVMANAGLNKDYYSDFSPSGYVHAKYHLTKSFSVFVNSNWYSYKFRDMPSVNTFSNEFGLTVHLHGSRANANKKSKVKAFVYHDRNSNGIYDAGDEPAKGYPVSINKRPFITNDKGEVTYRKVPFGRYEVGQISEKGWFGDADTLKVNSFKTTLQIPLQQAGVVTGRIRYNFDSKTSMEIEPKVEGIVFQIISTDGVLKHRVSTNDDAAFTAFLPTGEYRIELIKTSLPANTTCEDAAQTVKVEPGKIIRLKPFVINVQQKKVNIKRFGE